MKALTVQADGDKWKLKFEEKQIPEVSGEVCLVKLKAAALNRRDYWISVGKYPGIKSGATLGSDGSGEVVKGPDAWIGKKVWINPNISWGDNPDVQASNYTILGTPEDGTLAEYLAVSADRLVEIPSHLDFSEAAAIPLAGLTAYRAAFTKAQIKTGDKILITGIGGGVSQFATQFAIAAGADVYVNSSSEEKLERAMKMGVKAGFNYKEEGWLKEAAAHGKFDAVIDSAGGNAINNYLKLVKPGGIIVIYGSTTGRPEQIDLFRLFWSQVSIVGSTMGNDEEFSQMTQFVADHEIQPTIDKTYPFSEGIEAIQSMASSDQFGKVLIQIA